VEVVRVKENLEVRDEDHSGVENLTVHPKVKGAPITKTGELLEEIADND
jgi:hypothetical protein